MNSSSPGPAYAWIRSNILGLVAIFIALSGSAAAATVVIKHDSKGTTKAKVSAKAKAGPRGPAGAQGATGAQGAPGGNGAPGAQGPGALKLDFDQPETDATLRTLGTMNELTIEAQCQRFFPTPPMDDSLVSVKLRSTVAATASSSEIKQENTGAPLPLDTNYPVPPNTDTTLVAVRSQHDGYGQSEAQIIYRNANRVISIQLHAMANDANGRCQVYGTATPAS